MRTTTSQRNVDFNRFPLFQKIAPQLVTSLRFLHSKAHMVGIVNVALNDLLYITQIHLGMSPKTVLCSDNKCSDAAIFEYFNTWDGKVPTPVATTVHTIICPYHNVSLRAPHRRLASSCRTQ